MSEERTAEKAWIVDGHGLPDEARALVAEHGQPVHLRLSAPGHYPRTACDGGLGEWWTGKSTEVTCPACLEVVHA